MCYENLEVFKIYFLKGDSLMIPKKLLSSFVLMSLLFSSGDVCSSVQDPEISRLMPRFMKLNVALVLGGKMEMQSIQAQWERFIDHYPKQMDFNNITNSLNALYGNFVKQISLLTTGNQKRFLDFLGDMQSTLRFDNVDNELKFFLNEPQVKSEFIEAAMDNLKNPSSATVPPVSTVTPPSAPVINQPKINWNSPKLKLEIATAEKLIKENADSLPQDLQTKQEIKSLAILAQDFGPGKNDPKVIQHAEELLGLQNVEAYSREAIEQQADKLAIEIMAIKNQQVQELATRALNQTVEILDNQIAQAETPSVAPVTQPITYIKAKTVDPETSPSTAPAGKSLVSVKFRKKVASNAMELAQELLKDGQSVHGFFNKPEFANDNSEKIAYYKGYLQACLRMLSKNQVNPAPVISNIAEVLKVLNQKSMQASA